MLFRSTGLEIIGLINGLSTLLDTITTEDRDASPEEVDGALARADAAISSLEAAIARKRIRDAGE